MERGKGEKGGGKGKKGGGVCGFPLNFFGFAVAVSCGRKKGGESKKKKLISKRERFESLTPSLDREKRRKKR